MKGQEIDKPRLSVSVYKEWTAPQGGAWWVVISKGIVINGGIDKP